MIEIEETKHITENSQNIIILQPKGRLDINTAWQFRLKLQESISKISPYVIVNLSQVNFIDSSGLTALVAGMRNAEKFEGKLVICSIHPEARLVFEVTMMDSVFAIYETQEEALEGLFDLIN